jgi:MFS family permease
LLQSVLPLQQRHSVFLVIVIAQFCGTSLWFAGNAVLPQLQLLYHWPTTSLGFLTAATQLGFIIGTLTFALAGLSDRVSPSRLFFVCSILAASVNLLALVNISSYPLVTVSRCLVGFFLAGIYPVGMKIAADWSEHGLGHWLGAVVGALVLGTAFPHGLKLFPLLVNVNYLLAGISLICVFGGFLVLMYIPDGPYRKPATSFSFSAINSIGRIPSFKTPALAYFGHMWELYAFWTFVPWIVSHYTPLDSIPMPRSLLSFFVIASGGLGCMLGGWWSSKIGSKRVALYALIGSGSCCLLSPWILDLSAYLFIATLVIWGITVATDSPQLSALVATHAPEQMRGSAITIVVCIGFSITIISIQLLNFLQNIVEPQYLFLLLAPGPWAGVLALARSNK